MVFSSCVVSPRPGRISFPVHHRHGSEVVAWIRRGTAIQHDGARAATRRGGRAGGRAESSRESLVVSKLEPSLQTNDVDKVLSLLLAICSCRRLSYAYSKTDLRKIVYRGSVAEMQPYLAEPYLSQIFISRGCLLDHGVRATAQHKNMPLQKTVNNQYNLVTNEQS